MISKSAPAECEGTEWSFENEMQTTTHLELILSASELALLPFELAVSPPGCPGAGKPLLLQSQMPLCLTRRVRQNDRAAVSWRRKPRILFAAANPGTEIPLQEHVDALVSGLQPWIDRATYDENSPEATYGEHLTIITEASCDKIEKELASALDEQPPRPYTHVHLLAHGVGFEVAGNPSYGIQLHHPTDPSQPQNISADQLALALRPVGKQGSAGFVCPTVVTLASCQSGAQGSVVGAGSNVAHTLHEAGIPLVIASQFPLTFGGSVLMTKLLYRGFVRGHDPRVLLTRVRRELRGMASESHDWASLVAYAAFDHDLDEQLRDLRFHQARRSTAMALRSYDNDFANKEQQCVDAKNRYFFLKGKLPNTMTDFERDELRTLPDKFVQKKNRLEELLAWLNAAFERLIRVERETQRVCDTNVNGLIAATAKKMATIDEAYLRLIKIIEDINGNSPDNNKASEKKAFRVIQERLIVARDRYRRAWECDRNATWGQVQELALTLVLNDRPPAECHSIWIQAWRAAQWQECDMNPDERSLALRNQLELLLLRDALPAEGSSAPPETLQPLGEPTLDQNSVQATLILEKIIRTNSSYHKELKSLDEQLSRYESFFPLVAERQSSRTVKQEAPMESNSAESGPLSTPRLQNHEWNAIKQLAERLRKPVMRCRGVDRSTQDIRDQPIDEISTSVDVKSSRTPTSTKQRQSRRRKKPTS